jgi:hypothetical protein
METGKFFQRAALAGVVAIPIAAVAAVVVPDGSDDRVPCDGCGELFAPDALAPGESDTRWCRECVSDAGEILRGDPMIQEDDGEL